MRWIESMEQLPEPNQIVLAYSEVFSNYILAQWCPAKGWMNQEGSGVKIITHWLDFYFQLPFPILEEVNEEAAKRYKIRI